ncbi:MAG: RNA polymerase sigma factor, partial [Terrimicrobiaceae bacterium]
MMADMTLERTDAEWLQVYVDQGSDLAFEQIVSRHGPMVYRHCFRLLHDAHEAKDTSQAVFIVLAKQAGALRKNGNLTAWLYGVTRNVCRHALRCRMNRQRREEEGAIMLELERDSAQAIESQSVVLDLVYRELGALTSLQRQAVILRYIEGRREDNAAGLAGCSVDALHRRATDGIAKLRQRLAKRGVALGGVALAGLLTSEASAAVPETLLPSILAVVKTAAATSATATTTTSTAAMLAKGAMKAMFWNNVKTAAMVALSVGVVGVGGVAAVQAVAEKAAAVTASPMPKPALMDGGILPVTWLGDRPINIAAAGSRLWWNPKDMTLETMGLSGIERCRMDGLIREPPIAVSNANHLIRLADGRLLGLATILPPVRYIPMKERFPGVSNHPTYGGGKERLYPQQDRTPYRLEPIEIQNIRRSLGPTVLFTNDLESISESACDSKGHYLMVVTGSDRHGGRIIIWDLEKKAMMANLTDLPRIPHGADYGFTACAVSPDGGLGAAVDSGGGLLILELPAGTVRHRIQLPTPETIGEFGRDLVWEEGDLVCRGWPSKAMSTIRIHAMTGEIRERIDHPVIRHGDTTIHVRGGSIEVERGENAARKIQLPPIQWGAGGWSVSPDGRYLAGTTLTQSPVLVDLQEGRCLSPNPTAFSGEVAAAWAFTNGIVAGWANDGNSTLMAFLPKGGTLKGSAPNQDGSFTHARVGDAILSLMASGSRIQRIDIGMTGIRVSPPYALPPLTREMRAIPQGFRLVDDKAVLVIDAENCLRFVEVAPDTIRQRWALPGMGNQFVNVARCADGRVALGLQDLYNVRRVGTSTVYEVTQSLGTSGIYAADTGVRTTVFRQADGTEITDAVVIPVKGQRAYLQVYRQVDVTAKKVEMFRQNGQVELPKDKDGKEIKYFERQLAAAGLWDAQTGAWIKKLPEIGWGLFKSNHDGTLVIGSSATVVIETGEVLPGVAYLSDDGTLGVVTSTVTDPGSDATRRVSNVIDPRTGVFLACAQALGISAWQPGGAR